jgi:hypothetical protein
LAAGPPRGRRSLSSGDSRDSRLLIAQKSALYSDRHPLAISPSMAALSACSL